jgi:hypothetical protein
MPKETKGFEEETTDAPSTALALSGDEVRQLVLGSVSGVAREITEDMLSAETIDQLLSTTEPTAILVGVTFALKAWKWLRGQFTIAGTEQKGVFAVLEVLTLAGETKVVTTGSQNILAALLWFEDHGIVEPPPMTVRHSTTEAGNDVYRFAKAAGA